jgi:hypothetical protein
MGRAASSRCRRFDLWASELSATLATVVGGVLSCEPEFASLYAHNGFRHVKRATVLKIEKRITIEVALVNAGTPQN